MKDTIREVEERIAKSRREIVEYKKRVKEVEEADDYDHDYWQGLTDELEWERDYLKKDLCLLKILKRNFRRLEELKKLT